MIYEWREYRAAAGKSEDLMARFQDHTFPLFKRHGIEVTGFWTAKDDASRILYLCQFDNEAARDAAWAAFQNDSQWKEVKRNSEKEGSLTESLTSLLLIPVPWEGQQ